MTAKVLNFKRPVNGVLVEQRAADGFINATSMCVSHGKDVAAWLVNKTTFDLLNALAKRLGKTAYDPEQIKGQNSGDSSATKLSQLFPDLIFVKRGSPANGGGTWIHPKLAVQLAQWCSPEFALLVSDWVEEWMLTGQNPLRPDLDQEFIAWQERYDIRMYLKDFLRPELMKAVVEWAEARGKNPRTLCAQVHDAMNERIQGARSQQIRLLGGLPMSVLIRDYFGAAPLFLYGAINKLATNAIQDRSMPPITAVHEACDSFLGMRYTPTPVPILENVHARGRRLRAERQRRQAAQDTQMTIDFNQAS